MIEPGPSNPAGAFRFRGAELTWLLVGRGDVDWIGGESEMWKWVGGILAVAVLLVGVWVFVMYRDGSVTDTTSADSEEQEIPLESKVLMIPGYGGGKVQLKALGKQLAGAGVDWEIVDVGTGTGDLKQYAQEVNARADELREDGFAVDLVGYSAGGITARVAATENPDNFDHVITLSAPHQGTALADLGAAFGECPEACQQMRTGSPLLVSLDAADDGPDSDWLSIYSTTDEVIRPPESSDLDGAVVAPIQETCAEVSVLHGEVPTHGQTVALLLAFLEGEPAPEVCVV
jgi:triacylglycerol lipase